MSRLKALYRSHAIPATGKKAYGRRHREAWRAQLRGAGLEGRARRLYQELDALQALRREAKRDLMTECRKHKAAKWLRSVPYLGPIRAALLIGRVQTPHRFRTKRQFSGLLRPGPRDAHERRLSLRERSAGTHAQAGIHSRTELQSQS